MNAKLPGEALVIKLWETLADKAIGGLLRPWQIERVTAADTRARCRAIRELAQAKRDALKILSENGRGPESLTSGHTGVLIASSSGGESVDNESELDRALNASAEAMLHDSLRRELNVAQAVAHAEEELIGDSGPTPEGSADPDWLYRWRDCAGEVSSEELQALWGHLLAGEVKSPGSFSLRTLEFVRNLSSGEAQRIAAVAPFVIDGFIARDLLRLKNQVQHPSLMQIRCCDDNKKLPPSLGGGTSGHHVAG